MKAAILLLSLVSLVSHAGTPRLVKVPVDAIYSPSGFDTNDSVEVVVSGYLPNLCHKNPQTSYEVKGNEIHINVEAYKYHKTNPYCPEMVVPFLSTVKVGLLKADSYKIIVNGKSVYAKNSALKVSEASSPEIDDHVYAYITYVNESADKNLNKEVTLVGYNVSSCMVLDEIKFIDNGKNTYSVLPILKQVSEFCPMKMVPVEYKANIPEVLKSKKILLHVRSMDGNSVNKEIAN